VISDFDVVSLKAKEMLSKVGTGLEITAPQNEFFNCGLPILPFTEIYEFL
jgi:hypothetical protein